MEKKSYFWFNVKLSWSKIMAFMILIDATILDLVHDLDGRLFMYTLPFVVALIGSKQGIDAMKAIKAKLDG